LIENSARGVWALTPTAKNVNGLDPREIVKTVRTATPKGRDGDAGVPQTPSALEAEELGLIQWETLEPGEDDDRVNELLESNTAFQALVAKSKAGPRKPFTGGSGS
jgi:hypothetical protein